MSGLTKLCLRLCPNLPLYFIFLILFFIEVFPPKTHIFYQIPAENFFVTSQLKAEAISAKRLLYRGPLVLLGQHYDSLGYCRSVYEIGQFLMNSCTQG